MNIIIQNYKEMIVKILKTNILDNLDKTLASFTTAGNVLNYISLLSSLDEVLCSTMRQALVEMLEALDKSYRNSKERKVKYEVKSHHTRTILTIFGEVIYTRTFYKSKLNDKNFCYVDRLLGLHKYDYFDPFIKSMVIDLVSEANYTKTASIINDLIGNRIKISKPTSYMTRQTVYNIIKQANVSNPEVVKLKTPEVLYIMADEKWIHTQKNNKKQVMQKAIVVFDGIDSSNKKRHKLKNKMVFSGRNEDFIYEAINYIEKAYTMKEIKTFFVLGDGASWIKGLKDYFRFNKDIKVIQALDKFHLKQALWRIKSEDDVVKVLFEYILANNKNDFIRLVDEIGDLDTKRKEKIDENKKYILNNWTNILNLYKHKLSCPMESQISHIFAAYFTSRPKGYTKHMIDKLINHPAASSEV